MSVLVQEMPSAVRDGNLIFNDFNINVATANGSGSQTSNNVLIRSLFKMGIPVTGKNFFPSNIQGLPTWYQIRLSKEGYLARRDGIEITICMNGATVAEDMETAMSGGLILYDDALPIANHRKDVTFIGMPVKELVKQANLPNNLRDYVANFVYVGVVAYLLDIEMEEIHKALEWNFDGKAKPVQMNYDMAAAAYNWARENVENTQPYRVERMSGFNEGKVLVDGNTSAALGALFNGVNMVAWYPITPSSSLAEAINKYGPTLRKDPETGKNTYAVVQAEDELAAIGMVIGAGWAGARSMTSTSGPGISLMAEFAGLAQFAEIPSVIWDIQRMGPSTGLPTRTCQSDIESAYYLSHGDSRHPLLFPSTPQECFEMAGTAFDLAERLQTLVFVLSDLDLGMNLWISEPFEYPEAPMDRGKVLSAEDLSELKGNWGRYVDVDGDGIPYRTVPGTKHPAAAYFTRGTGHNEYAVYSERKEDWENNMVRLERKFNTARELVPAPIVEENPQASIGIMTLGSNDPAVREAMDRLQADGVETSYMRLRALPISQQVKEFVAAHDQVYVVENNFNGQLCTILRTEMPALATRLVSVSKCDGLPLSARWITESILAEMA
ncbi:MAG: 2-oxoacid:acceptor oxidoreductase subunit alpha [Caldilineaceae bacterium]|nr:2-oxoacid:acceptor oxidoreductase subunit alpha [Caldilineaceae bacterium]